MRWKDYFLLIFEIRVCHFLVSDMGGGGSRQNMTKCDKGGRGVKNSDFRSDVIFEWPLAKSIEKLRFPNFLT